MIEMPDETREKQERYEAAVAVMVKLHSEKVALEATVSRLEGELAAEQAEKDGLIREGNQRAREVREERSKHLLKIQAAAEDNARLRTALLDMGTTDEDGDWHAVDCMINEPKRPYAFITSCTCEMQRAALNPPTTEEEPNGE